MTSLRPRSLDRSAAAELARRTPNAPETRSGSAALNSMGHLRGCAVPSSESQPVRRVRQCRSEFAVRIDGKVSRQNALRTRRIGAEDQLPGWCIVPTPFGDLGEEATDRVDTSDSVCDGDRLTGDGVDGGGRRGEERLDVPAAVQVGQQGDVGGR